MRLAGNIWGIIGYERQSLLPRQAVLDQTGEINGPVETRACSQSPIWGNFGTELIVKLFIVSILRVDYSAVLVYFKFFLLLFSQIELLLLFLTH